MRHRVKTERLNRNPAHLNALLRNMATSLILYEKIKTTEARAKLVRVVVEKAITMVKKKDLSSAMRELNQFFPDKNASKKLTRELKDRYKDRPSGFTRVVKLGFRTGDAAPVVQLELV
ncbi:MAG: 50S ribosomal protein L17 [Candidatus Peregrinibacteria bacterium]